MNDWLNDGLEIEYNHETVATWDSSVPKPVLCKHCHSIQESADASSFVRYHVSCIIPRVVAIASEAGQVTSYACLDCLLELAALPVADIERTLEIAEKEILKSGGAQNP
jgi:hypothetical protein